MRSQFVIYRPENVLFMGAGLYVLVFILSPLDAQVSLEIGALVFIGLCTAALTLGSRIADTFPSAGVRHRVTVANLRRKETRLFWTTLLIGGVGNLLRLVDKYILRDAGALVGLDAREMLIENSTTTLSLISGILYPFGYLPIFILLGASLMPRSRWKFGLAIFLFLIPSLDALVLFSRSVMLVSFAMIYFGISLTLFHGRALPRQLVLPTLVGVGGILSISVMVFLWRLDQMAFEVSRSIFLSGYAYTVPPNSDMRLLVNEGGATAEAAAGILSIAQYYVHSIFEFQLLWNMSDTQVFSGGALHFGPYYKVLAMFDLVAEPDLFELFPRVGIFTSYWGPLWVDFGWFSPIFMFGAGFFARRIGMGAEAADVGAYPLYTYLCVILFFMPVVNFAISAQGMYVINAFVIFWLVTRGTSRAMPV